MPALGDFGSPGGLYHPFTETAHGPDSMRPFASLALTFVLLAGPAVAADTPSGLPVPRFVSLKFTEVNGRAGPSEQHPVVWQYHLRGLPMQVVAETENWRRVRDPEGELVWMHRRTLDGRRTALVTAETPLLARAESGAAVKAVAEPGVVVQIRACKGEWRRVAAGDYQGWAPASALWGAGCGEADGDAAPEDAGAPEEELSSLQAGLGE